MARKPKKTTLKKKIPLNKRTSKKSNINRTVYISILSMTLFVFMGFSYYFIVHKNKEESFPSVVVKNVEQDVKMMPKNISKVKVKKPKKKQIPFKERGKNDEKVSSLKPKLAIIIDDVHSQKQIEAIKSLGMKLTPSIFPPYTLAKKSHHLAKMVKHYMIHLPMESKSKQLNKQTKTLLTSFSDEDIVDRVMEIRKLFPDGKYINNHTGSVFTSNYKAMKKLYIALRIEGFIFVDSFTIASSKVKKIAGEFAHTYLKRDIFIDNEHEVSYIHKQLREAVKVAKKKGYAIAIGHPHKVTMEALKSASNILKDVELVYIDAI